MNSKLFKILSLLRDKNVLLSKSVLIAWLGFFIAVVITILLWINAQKNTLEEAKTRFNISNANAVHEITARMHTYENTLRSGVSLLSTVERMNRKKWNIYISRMQLAQHYPGFQGIGFTKVIPQKKLVEHIAKIRADGFVQYSIKPSYKRAEYHSIIYLEPLDERNRRAIGYDMFTDPIRQQAMVHARDTGLTTLSGKVTLVQEQATDIQPGFLMYVPYYATQNPLMTPSQRRAHLDGFVYAPFRSKDLMNEILLHKNPNISIKLYDGTSISDKTLLYESSNTLNTNPLFTETIPIVMYGRTWTAVFQTLPSFKSTLNNNPSRLIILAGLPISFLLLLTILSFSQTTKQAQSLARKMTVEIQALNDELENMINTAPNPIIVHTEDGNIVKINKTWTDICGYTHEETPTTDSWVDKVYKEHQDEIKTHIRNLFNITHKVDEGEFSFFSKSGTKVTWQFSSALFGIIDGKKALISSAMDITELKNKDDMMMMQSRYAAMGEMINMIAHQWRQPLASISSISGLLSLEAMMDQYNKNHFIEKLDLVSDLSVELSDTINDFRNFFKEDKTKELTTWKELLEGCLTIIKPILTTKSITVETTYHEDHPFMTYPRELRQVILNILNNAEDILMENAISEPKIRIRTFLEEKMSCMEIEDNGRGIPAEIINQIFDPYFSTKMEKNGTGIGLYMSKTIVEKHGKGSLHVYNTARGACFKISLPLDK
ncbi:MAG: CHASE domain-containing protein [Sulfuricurvum sp.]|uniref:CHASE domain-containing protein n=1 Tax=Sulfuricurvum sp. TaxID=2025608 RepID=UPI002615AA41|nr:CHASE domain-containing protein [Sulfuricurvum sp.]MDD2949810.1 CHASE domain-containing protein [Sulfuricurvum sp.]MDD5118651.1 CHASE domain-containing protein [Sulfuricurvum sp.]